MNAIDQQGMARRAQRSARRALHEARESSTSQPSSSYERARIVYAYLSALVTSKTPGEILERE